MIRIPGWILGAVLVLVVAACGAGDRAEETPSTTAVQPPAQPDRQPPSQPTSQPGREPRLEPVSEPEPAPPAVPEGRLYTVQVGSFISPDSARVWAERLERRGLPVWTEQAVVGGRRFHRVRVGATPSLAEARRLGDQLRRDYRWPVWIAPVEDNADVPANAISRTHALVSGARAR